ncbi:hypothetical protein [Catenulispora subtropica]|uniref:Uncharacterized protein n=1 Tax=Catenulispora subtropica TaxID=450798 RepID=A0ABN2REB9_9ACTN
MDNHERYAGYQEDANLLAAIGELVDAQVGRVTVRLPKTVAEAAVAAWERDDPYEDTLETTEQREVRGKAADLAMIGLEISQRGRVEGEEVVVDLRVGLAGAAVVASL